MSDHFPTSEWCIQYLWEVWKMVCCAYIIIARGDEKYYNNYYVNYFISFTWWQIIVLAVIQVRYLYSDSTSLVVLQTIVV